MAVSLTGIETVKVYTAMALHADLADWTETPSILPIGLTRRMFPEVDSAKFVYHVGAFAAHFAGVAAGNYGPVYGMRGFIRIRITSGRQVLDDWIGIVNRQDVENMLIHPTYVVADMSFTAFGLNSDLDNTLISSTHIANSITSDEETDFFEIRRAIGFNEDPRGVRPGNMQGGSSFSGCRVFARLANQEITDTAGEPYNARWSVKQAIEYTLRHDATPFRVQGAQPSARANTFQWGFTLQEQTLLDVLPFPTVSREGKTVSQVLSELVTKKSGIAARVGWDNRGDDPTKLRVIINYISTSASEFRIGTVRFFASPEKWQLNLRMSSPAISFSFSESAYSAWDQVVVESAYVTTTATIPLDDDSTLIPAWSSEQEAAYRYPDVSTHIDDEDKNLAADKFRSSRKNAEVFRTWTLNYQYFTSPTGTNFFIRPSGFFMAPDPDRIDVVSLPPGRPQNIRRAYYYDGVSAFDQRIDLYRKEFLPELPIPYDVTDGKPKLPNVFFLTDRYPEDPEEPIDYLESGYTYGDKLAKSGSWYDGRSWSVTVSTGNGESKNNDDHLAGPAIYLDVNGGPQHFIAKSAMEDATFISPQNDVTSDKVQALDFKDAFVTVAMEADIRYTARYPETITLNTDAPAKIKRVVFDNLRLDIALPGYVDRISDDGTIGFSLDGKLLRDDRVLINNLAKTLWQQASIARRPFSLVMRELTTHGINIGALIEKIYTAAGVDDTNSVVTQIEYDFKDGTIAYATQYEEMEVVELVIAQKGNGRV